MAETTFAEEIADTIDEAIRNNKNKKKVATKLRKLFALKSKNEEYVKQLTTLILTRMKKGEVIKTEKEV